MPNIRGHSFLVHPSKSEDTQPIIGGVRIPSSGKLFDMLSKLYTGAPTECDIEIQFRPMDDGRQENEARSLFLNYLINPTIEAGRAIAAQLQAVTTHRSGLGLLFVIADIERNRSRLMISRFPADEGVIAQEQARGLNLEFIERVFMKSARAYKNVLYSCASPRAGFWHGFAVDRQTGEGQELSNYWISEFLKSELRTTGAAGTKRMAVALRSAMRKADPIVREELWSAARLMRGQAGHRMSMSAIASRLRLSQDATDALRGELSRPELFTEAFQFDRDEFDKHIAYRSVELDNGALMIADNADFERVFVTEPVGDGSTVHRYSTVGSVVQQGLRKTK